LPFDLLGDVVPTRLGKRHESEAVIKTQDPHGRDIYWIGLAGAAKDAGEGTDFHATAQGKISVTPLQIDLTHSAQLAALKRELQ
jgi:5'-nucleotidase